MKKITLVVITLLIFLNFIYSSFGCSNVYATTESGGRYDC